MGATGASVGWVADLYQRGLTGVPRRIVTVHLIVTPESLRVERPWRDEAGRWWQAEAVGPEGGIAFVSYPEIELTLAQIYEGL